MIMSLKCITFLSKILKQDQPKESRKKFKAKRYHHVKMNLGLDGIRSYVVSPSVVNVVV
jgi:hypothetical protein